MSQKGFESNFILKYSYIIISLCSVIVLLRHKFVSIRFHMHVHSTLIRHESTRRYSLNQLESHLQRGVHQSLKSVVSICSLEDRQRRGQTNLMGNQHQSSNSNCHSVSDPKRKLFKTFLSATLLSKII